MLHQVFEDGALMDTLDGEVRADVEAAARILAKRTVAGCAVLCCPASIRRIFG